MNERKKTAKERIEQAYGSVNGFIMAKLKEYQGVLPMERTQIYKLLNHETVNPGIKTLAILADMAGLDRAEVFEEYAE